MKKNIHRLSIKIIHNCTFFMAIGGLLMFFGNSGIRRSQASEIREDARIENIEQNLSTAIQKIIELSTEKSSFEDNLEEDNEIDTISFRDLIGYLPQSPKGWIAEKPKGQTNSFGSYRVSQVKQSYFQKDKTMTVSIFDWAFNSALYMPFLLSTEFSQESTEGYNKGIKIGNIPGRENYDYYTKDGSLNLLVNRRFFVQIEGENIEESELREWWEAIDSDSLSKEK